MRRTKEDHNVVELSSRTSGDRAVRSPAQPISSGPRAARALVVFTAGPRPWWLHWLHPEIGHCFVVIDQGNRWILLDSLAHRLELKSFVVVPGEDLAAFYRALGYQTILAPIAEAPERLAPVQPFTCVEVVKRAIGLHSWRIVTPFQLFCYLKKIWQIGKKALTWKL